MRYLVLAEKPDQAEKYAAALGNSKKIKNNIWQVYSDILKAEVWIAAAVGHIVEMVDPYKNYENWQFENLPVMPDKFEYQVVKEKSSVFNNIKSAIKECDVIIIGTDADREGEAIAYRILNKIPGSIKKVKYRLWVSSLTEKGIRLAFSNLRPASDTKNLYHEANARSIADWLVGFNLSPWTTIKIKEDGILDKKEKALTVGRVQTPIVTLIVDNDDDINNFEPEIFYNIILKDSLGTQFTSEEKFNSKSAAEKILNNLSDEAVIKEITQETKKQESEKLFNLTSLQSYMSKKYRIDSSQTLALAQSLYQKKYLSYPRSDLRVISSGEFEYLKSFLTQYLEILELDFEPVNSSPRSRFVNDKKVAEYSHYAIIPTEEIPDLNSLGEQERLLYLEVVKRTVLMFADDYTYQSTIMSILNNGVIFNAKGNVTKNLGWTKFLDREDKEEVLPDYLVEQHIPVQSTIKEGKTTPPSRLTEANLLDKVLPKYNLGTSATRAGIIKNILERDYIKKEKNTGKLYPTERGRLLVYYLSEFDIAYTNPKTTGIWEEQLSLIGKGQKAEEVFIDQVKQAIRKQIKN